MIVLSYRSDLAQEFVKLAAAVTGQTPEIADRDDGKSDLVLIGSDAVNLTTHLLIEKRLLPALGLREGCDDYRIFAASGGTRRILLLAGGRTRADYYAIYDYFERYCACRYFWDGDKLPHREALPMEKIDFVKRFRFRYRGLRYFAHRSLHRFQAEHWSLPEWENELHYLLKKKFNLFMLRIGADDQFQQAFPDVPYPPEDRRDPDAAPRSYNDRTAFWGLKERGRIRKEIIKLARELDLQHPVDMGPMTHWYSRTPQAFLDQYQPQLRRQNTKDYSESTGLAWELSVDENVENYWRLTEAELRRGDRPEIFHMCGLAERRFGTPEENFQLKMYSYRRFIRRLREEYPNAVIFLAGWDLMLEWTPDEVRRLISELDKENTVILDYTEDLQYQDNDFVQWGLPYRFPYIFGIFQGVERYSGCAFDFAYTERNFQQTVNDPYCRGMVMWPEISHAHTLLHEYLARRSAEEDFSLGAFCQDRYGAEAEAMREVWQKLEKEFAANSFHRTRLVFDDTFNLLDHLAEMPKDHPESAMREEFRKLVEMRPVIPGIYAALARIAARSRDGMVLRDAGDLARTHLMSDMVREFAVTMDALWAWRKDGGAKPSGNRFVKLTRLMAELLSTADEYSLSDSLKKLASVHPLNPASEETLKGNAENFYCRSYVMELAKAIYVPEAEFWCRWIAEAAPEERCGEQTLREAEARIREEFYAQSLAFYRPKARPELADVLQKLAEAETR